MANKTRPLRVLIATDGSRSARAAITTAINFPWPPDTQLRVVVARRTRAEHRQSLLLAGLDRGPDAIAERARRTLSRRWPAADAVVVDKTPVAGIIEEADRFGANAIVLGWRGHGAIRRLLTGSVSRGVVRGARCTVLVVRRPVRVRRLVVGLDGSAAAKRALAFVAGLKPPADGRVILLTAVDVMPVPSRGLVPGATSLAHEVKRDNTHRIKAAAREQNRAAARLQRAGWRTRTMLTTGEPLRDLLRAVTSTRAQLLVVGGRGTSRIRHLLLGSVAEGALNRSPVPILIGR
jgi:nucleotide-binding universal stress UspA family protein